MTRPVIAAALALAACAGAPRRGDGGYAFPDRFEATQAVTVTLADGSQEFIASLRRRGHDFEVTLFDPVFSFPVVSSSLRGGVASETRHTDVVRPGDGERLARLLATVYEGRFARPAAGAASVATRAVEVRLEGIPDGRPCPFPDVIEVRPRLGAGPQVRVRTLDVTCDAGGPGPAAAGAPQ